MLKIIFVCVAYLLIKTDVVSCKPDYLFKPEALGWLKLHRTPETWQEALLKCHYEGAVLASPLNKGLANAIRSLAVQSIGHNPIFLGTQDLFSKGDFLSVEGVLLTDFEIKWESYNINDGRCLTMIPDNSENSYYLRSISCDDPLPYVCYRRLDNKTINQCGTFDNEYRFNKSTGSCYKVHQEAKTWNRAHRICVAEGAHLVILNDNEEARIIRDVFPDIQDLPFSNSQEPLHIGLLAWGEDSVNAIEGIWMTIHGEKIEDVYHDWSDNRMLNSYDYRYGHSRGALLRSGKLGIISANAPAIFVCEKSPDSIRFEAPALAIEEEIQ